MHRWFPSLFLVLVVGLLGCEVVQETPYFPRGGDRPEQPEALPEWGVDNCGAPGSTGSPWSGPMVLDFSLDDQYGRTVRLHHFCGRALLLVSLSMAWEESGVLLEELEALRNNFAPWDFAVVALVGEDLDGGVPTVAALEALATAYGAEFAVLADPGWEVTLRFVEGVPSSRSMHLYSAGLQLESVGLAGVDLADIDALIGFGETS